MLLHKDDWISAIDEGSMSAAQVQCTCLQMYRTLLQHAVKTHNQMHKRCAGSAQIQARPKEDEATYMMCHSVMQCLHPHKEALAAAQDALSQ